MACNALSNWNGRNVGRLDPGDGIRRTSPVLRIWPEDAVYRQKSGSPKPRRAQRMVTEQGSGEDHRIACRQSSFMRTGDIPRSVAMVSDCIARRLKLTAEDDTHRSCPGNTTGVLDRPAPRFRLMAANETRSACSRSITSYTRHRYHDDLVEHQFKGE